MGHTLEQFAAQCHACIKAEPGPAGRKKVAALLQEVLKDKAFVDQHINARTGERKILYEDPEFGVPYYTETAKATTGHCRPWNGSLVDVASARKIIAAVYFDLIKGAEAQNTDIAAVLTRAQDEYNKLVE